MNKKSSLVVYLEDLLLDDNYRQEVIRSIEIDLPDFLRKKLEVDVGQIFDLTNIAQALSLQDQIRNSPILQSELDQIVGVKPTTALNYYIKFLQKISLVGGSDKAPNESGHLDQSTKSSMTRPMSQGTLTPDTIADDLEEKEKSLQNHNQQEGEIRNQTILYRGRNRKARAACIEYYQELFGGRIRCYCCGFDFEQAYGKIGQGFVEVHHIIQLSSTDGVHIVDPEKDLVPLCSNCHSMIHYGKKGELMKPDKLKEIIKTQKI